MSKRRFKAAVEEPPCRCREYNHWLDHIVYRSIGTGMSGRPMRVIKILQEHDGWHASGPSKVRVRHEDGTESDWSTMSLERKYS